MWFYRTADGEEVGPVSGLDMVKLIEEGQLVETTPVRRERSDQWLEAWQTDRAGYLRHHDRQSAYQQNLSPAHTGRRLVAYVIDLVIHGLLGYGLMMLIMSGVWGDVRQNWLITIALWLFVPLLVTYLYFVFSIVGHHQATPGMRAMAMHVTRLQGGRVGWWRAMLRPFVFFLTLFFPVLLLVVFLNPRRRMVQDWASGTRVVAGAYPKRS